MPTRSEQAEAEAEAEQEYPPDTYRWMSWSAMKFIHRPLLAPLVWITCGMIAVLVGAVVASFFVTIKTRVQAPGEIAAYPTVLPVVSYVEGLMLPRVSPGTSVSKGQVVGMLQMDVDEAVIEKVLAALDANAALVEAASRRRGLSDKIETGQAVAELKDDPGVQDAAITLQNDVRQLQESLEGLGAFEAGKGAVIRQSRLLSGLLTHYLEQHRLRSPAAGTLMQFEVPANAHVRPGDVAATILPEGSSLLASLALGADDVPNVSVGQRVRYQLEAYPYQHYGFFEGTVTQIERSMDNGAPRYIVRGTIAKPPTLPERLAKDVRLVIGMKLQGQVITGKSTIYDLVVDSLLGKR